MGTSGGDWKEMTTEERNATGLSEMQYNINSLSCFLCIWDYFEESWWRTSPYKAANGAKEVEKEERVAVIGHVHPKALANHNLEPFLIFF